MKDVLLARAAGYRERAAVANQNAETAASEDLRQTYRGLAHAWIDLAKSVEAAAALPSGALKPVK